MRILRTVLPVKSELSNVLFRPVNFSLGIFFRMTVDPSLVEVPFGMKSVLLSVTEVLTVSCNLYLEFFHFGSGICLLVVVFESSSWSKSE